LGVEGDRRGGFTQIFVVLMAEKIGRVFLQMKRQRRTHTTQRKKSERAESRQR